MVGHFDLNWFHCMNRDCGCATIVLVSFVGVDSFVQWDSVLALKSFTLKLSPLISQPPPLPPYLLSSLFTASIFFICRCGWLFFLHSHSCFEIFQFKNYSSSLLATLSSSLSSMFVFVVDYFISILFLPLKSFSSKTIPLFSYPPHQCHPFLLHFLSFLLFSRTVNTFC